MKRFSRFSTTFTNERAQRQTHSCYCNTVKLVAPENQVTPPRVVFVLMSPVWRQRQIYMFLLCNKSHLKDRRSLKSKKKILQIFHVWFIIYVTPLLHQANTMLWQNGWTFWIWLQFWQVGMDRRTSVGMRKVRILLAEPNYNHVPYAWYFSSKGRFIIITAYRPRCRRKRRKKKSGGGGVRHFLFFHKKFQALIYVFYQYTCVYFFGGGGCKMRLSESFRFAFLLIIALLR